MKADEISDLTVKLSQGIRNGDEGYLFGGPEQDINGVVLAWKPTLAAMHFTVAKNCNMLITHEFLHDFEYTLPQPAYIQDALHWKANIARQNYLKSNSLIVYHWHGGMLRVKGVTEHYRRVFGLRAARKSSATFAKENPLFYLEQMIGVLAPPVRLSELLPRVKKALRVAKVRVIGALDRKVAQVGIGAGGDALFTNMATINAFIARGVDVIIGGESDAYAAEHLADAGVALIETDHPATDNIAIQHAYETLRKLRLGVPLHYYEQPPVWKVV